MRDKGFLTLLFLSWVGVVLALTQWMPAHAQDAGIPIATSGQQSAAPAIAIGPENVVHIAWEQEDGIWYRRWQLGHLTPLMHISAEGKNPTLAVDPYDDIAYLAWEQAFAGNYEIFTRKWDALQGWSAPHNVSNNAGGSTSPTLVVSSMGMVHLLWSDTTPGSNTLYHAISSNGESWPVATPIDAARGSHPSAAIDAQGVLHVAWQYRASFADNLRIWTSSKVDGVWLSPVALTDGTSQAFSPQLRSRDDKMLLVWQEGTQSILATMQDSGWQQARAQAGAAPAVAISGQGAVEWAWQTAQGLAREYHHAVQWPRINWSVPGARHVALAAQDDCFGLVWIQGQDANSQVFFTYDRPVTTYQPIFYK
jgi:hypothetical protein